MEKLINKLGPKLAQSLGPAALDFLMKNQWLVPIILGGSVAMTIMDLVKN